MTDLLTFVLAGAAYLDPLHAHDEMAAAIARVVESERPLFRNDAARLLTASYVLAVAYREGSLGLSVVGDCTDSKPGEPCKGKPRSYCTMQIHVTSGGGPALNEDPELCIRTGVAMLRTSMRICSAHPAAFYASGPGACDNVRAQRISRDRTALAGRIFKATVAKLAEVTQ